MKLQLKPNYTLIPFIVIVVALLGSVYSSAGMSWYDAELIRPALTPPKLAFPIAWTTIFILSAISALIIWNKGKKDKKFLWFKVGEKYTPYFWWIVGLFIANAVLNVLWSFLFFYKHLITAALVEMIFLEATVIALCILTWRISKAASVMLFPYAIWVAFATYLTYLIVVLN